MRRTFLGALALAALVGCGGGGGERSSSNEGGTAEPPVDAYLGTFAGTYEKTTEPDGGTVLARGSTNVTILPDGSFAIPLDPDRSVRGIVDKDGAVRNAIYVYPTPLGAGYAIAPAGAVFSYENGSVVKVKVDSDISALAAYKGPYYTIRLTKTSG